MFPTIDRFFFAIRNSSRMLAADESLATAWKLVLNEILMKPYQKKRMIFKVDRIESFSKSSDNVCLVFVFDRQRGNRKKRSRVRAPAIGSSTSTRSAGCGRPFRFFCFVFCFIPLSLSLSLSHTHTHTHTACSTFCVLRTTTEFRNTWLHKTTDQQQQQQQQQQERAREARERRTAMKSR